MTTHLDNAIKSIIDYDYALENESIDDAVSMIIKRAQDNKRRAEAAEARAADLLKANREQAEALATLRAERNHWIDAYKAQEAGYNAAVAGASKFAQQRDALAEQLKKAQREMCKCGKNPAADPHPCPYQSDVNNDPDFQCTCCADCTNECAMDI